jgi:hypothetical protein
MKGVNVIVDLHHLSLVSIGPQGHRDHPARDSRAQASSRLPSVLALEIPFAWRPKIGAELRALIRLMSAENPLWGAPRIHGELLKLGFEVGQSGVAKYMVKRCGPPSQAWRTFLRNHAPDIAAMDLSVVPTIGFDLLYVLVIVRLAAETLSGSMSAEWIAHQITEAFPWNEDPRYARHSQSWLIDLNGDTNKFKRKKSSATIVADVT